MADLTLRNVKGSPLTNQEVDDNFSNLNTDKWSQDNTKISNWDTAYGWGDHAAVGYLTSFTETDPTVPSHVKSITTTEKTNWNTAYSWGDHAAVGYLTSIPSEYLTETEGDARYLSINATTLPDQTGHAGQFLTTNGTTADWATVDTSLGDTAYGWGNHASVGYLTSASLTGYATQTYVNTAVSNLVDSAPATLDTLNELAAALGDDPNFATTVTNSIATKLPLAGGTLSGNLIFGDNDKAIFGAGSDLQIFHDGSFSYIKESGTGDLRIQGSTNVQIWNSALDKQAANFNAGGGQTLFYDNAAKLATTATGIDVTGTVTADGLVVSAPSGDTPASIVTTTAGSFLEFTDVNTTAGRSPLVGAITDNLAFYTNAGSYSQKMTLTASGNLGLGVTPSAWNSGYKAMQLLTGALYGTSSRDTNLGANVFVNAGGGYAYIQSSFATNYTQFNGVHSWFTAPSGTAGNAISFTQAMTLDSSGNLLVGTTSAFGTTGTTINQAGLIFSSADADRAGQFDRTSNDGEIVRFSKAGTTVGSIGSAGSGVRSYYAGNNVGISPYNGVVYPTDGSGTAVNNSADLGANGYAFKDLYLTGALQIGGTTVINSSRQLRSINAIYNTSDTQIMDLGNITYTILKDPEGSIRMYLGDTGDAGNYYDNTIHYFRNRAAAPQVQISDGGVNLQNTSATYKVQGTTVIDSSRNLTNIGTLNGGTPWHSGNDGSGSGLDADLLDGLHASSFVRSDANTSLASGHKWTFHSGAGGTSFSANHYSMGVDIANGDWSGPNYSDLIIGYHTGIRIGAAYSGTRFYANSPTTDANNDGNGDGGETLLMTVGGVPTGGNGVRIENTLTVGGVTNSNSYSVGAASANGRLINGSWGFRHQTDYGYIEFGPANTSYAHIYTDRPSFYLDKDILVNNNSVWHAGNDGSGSGLDADLLDGQQPSALSVNYANTAGAVAWGSVSSKPDHIMNYEGFTLNADTMGTNTTGFTYGVGAPAVGPIARFSAGGNYDLWLNAPYSAGGTILYFRTRNGDTSANNAWYNIWASGNDGSGSGLDADLLDGIQAASFLRSDADDTFTGNLTTGANNHITFGPNSAWGSSLRVGGNGRTATGTEMASIVTTDGNIHLDAAASDNGIYINYYAGTNGTHFGNGASAVVAKMDNAGQLYKSSTTANPYWNSANDGSGSGLDADLLDGVQGSGYQTRLLQQSNSNLVLATGTTAAGGLFLESSSGQFIFQLYGNQSQYGFLASEWGSWDIKKTPGGSMVLNNSDSNIVWHGGNDGSGSGLDADLLDGVQGTSFLRSDAADTFTGTLTMGTQVALEAANHGRGIFGVYSASVYQHVWSMGAPYKLADNGVSSGLGGNLYGLAWTYNPNYAYAGSNAQARAGFNHQLLLMMNGISYTALGNGIWTAGTISSNPQGTLWGASNDGSGSGLDADLLDGLQASSFVQQGGGYYTNGNTAAFASANDTTLSVRSNGPAAATMSFHRPGYYAANFGLDSDNQLKYGGWSAGDVHPVMHDGISGGSVSTSTNGGGVNYVYNVASATPTRGSCGTHIYHQWSNNLVLNLTSATWQQGDVVVVKSVRGAVNITVNASVIYLPNGSYDNSVTFNGTVGSFTLIKYNTTTGQWMVGP